MGGEDTVSMVASSGEPLVPAFADLLKVYNAKALAASEVIKVSPHSSYQGWKAHILRPS